MRRPMDAAASAPHPLPHSMQGAYRVARRVPAVWDASPTHACTPVHANVNVNLNNIQCAHSLIKLACRPHMHAVHVQQCYTEAEQAQQARNQNNDQPSRRQLQDVVRTQCMRPCMQYSPCIAGSPPVHGRPAPHLHPRIVAFSV